MDDLEFTLNQLCAYFAIRVRDKSEPLDVHRELFEKAKSLKDAYESKSNGFNTLVTDYNSGYKDGLQEAWECARKIYAFDSDTLYDAFRQRIKFEVLKDNSASEAIAKLKKYEAKRDEIKVGDEVEYCEHRKGVITYVLEDDIYVMWRDGSAGRVIRKYLNKTGRHFDIDGILGQLKGTDDEQDIPNTR